jgi:L-seryl-tRNA(Ser) seleniumtransferase
VALLTALDLFVSGAYDSQIADYRRWLNAVADGLRENNVATRLVEPATSEQWPVLRIHVDSTSTGRSAMDVCRELREGNPPVYVGHAELNHDQLVINPTSLDEHTIPILIQRLQSALG